MSDRVIDVRGLHMAYGDVEAVRGIDLHVDRGEVFALLGPNGAGKTTTVEILEGYRRRSGGEVSVLGADPSSGAVEQKRRIGIVLQSTGVDPFLTVRETVEQYAGYYRSPRDVDEVIELVGLAEKRTTRVNKLSGGQHRRLDVAVALAGDPELLFLDEPTTGFDPQARREFWDLIRGLATGGTTILLTTHYLDEAEHLADRVGVIAAGRLLALDTPANLGGRQSEEATVSWDEDGERRSIRTATPTADVTRIAARFPGEVPELVVSRPSLEDTYLELITPHVTHDTLMEVPA